MQDQKLRITIASLVIFGVGFLLGYLVRGGVFGAASATTTSSSPSIEGRTPLPTGADGGMSAGGAIAVTSSGGAAGVSEPSDSERGDESSVAVVGQTTGTVGSGSPAGGGARTAGVPLSGASDGGRPMGRLEASAIRDVVREHRDELGFCFAWQLHQHPELQGRITMSFTIGEGGRVTRAEVAEDELGDETVLRCFVNVTRRMEFPAPEGGEVSVRYPFQLSPGDDASHQ